MYCVSTLLLLQELNPWISAKIKIKEGEEKMGSLGDYLMEELSLKTSFTIPIGGGIPVPQSAVTTWVIMAIVVLLCIIFVRNLKVIPEGPQVYVEALVGFIYNFIGGLVGEKGKRYIPFLGTILIYLGCANISGIFQSKTANERSECYRRISDHQFVFDHIFRNPRERIEGIYTQLCGTYANDGGH